VFTRWAKPATGSRAQGGTLYFHEVDELPVPLQGSCHIACVGCLPLKLKRWWPARYG
jgi:hypothetical protein